MEITPVSASGSSQIIVGEDIVGSISRSRIIATVLDTSGNPKIGQAIAFTAMVLGESVGQIIVNSNLTDNQGQVYAYFDDSGDPIVDILGTSEYEGVTLTAYLGDSQVRVYKCTIQRLSRNCMALYSNYEFRC